MSSSAAVFLNEAGTESRQVSATDMDVVTRRLVTDLHAPRPVVFWTDLLASATIGWGAFAVAVSSAPWSLAMFAAVALSGFALYRGLCFTHELTHLRRRSVPGFETVVERAVWTPAVAPLVYVHRRAPKPPQSGHLRHEGRPRIPALCQLSTSDLRLRAPVGGADPRAPPGAFPAPRAGGPGMATVPSLAGAPRVVVFHESRISARGVAGGGQSDAALGTGDHRGLVGGR